MTARPFLLLCAVLVLPTCSSPSDLELPDTRATIEGPIVARDVATSFSDEGQPTFHVKEGDDDPCGIIFTVEEFTEIARRNATGELIEARVEELTVGTRVRVWARGGIAESCPAQGRAEAVEIR